jgi:hypothetical protein
LQRARNAHFAGISCNFFAGAPVAPAGLQITEPRVALTVKVPPQFPKRTRRSGSRTGRGRGVVPRLGNGEEPRARISRPFEESVAGKAQMTKAPASRPPHATLRLEPVRDTDGKRSHCLSVRHTSG